MERGAVAEDVDNDVRAVETAYWIFCNFVSCNMQSKHSATSASSPGRKVGACSKTATTKSMSLVLTSDQLEDGLLRTRNNVHSLSRIRVLLVGESSTWVRMDVVWYKHCNTAFM